MSIVQCRRPFFGILAVISFFLLDFSIPLREDPAATPEPNGAASFIHYTGFDTLSTDLHDYMWPTDASRKVTSSFAEYRSTHFHGGIDISTNGQRGARVFASRDGYVYRIVISPFGYGKMLYVKHRDGYVTTYAHLMTFNDTINRVVRAEQYRRRTYSVDFTPDPLWLPVRKGDIIAYSGNSGFGPPHLHFEVRDENLNPMNPLLCDGFKIDDNIPPRILRVMVAPLDYESTVDNSPHARYFSRFPRKKGVYLIPQPIRLHGKAGFGVTSIDHVNGSASKTGVHRIEFYIDDSLTFSVQLDRAPAKDTKQIDLHYDLSAIVNGNGEFQKLYLETGNVLPFYNHRPEGSGIVDAEHMQEGDHSFRIICKDATGNKTELTGTLLINHTPEIKISEVGDREVVLTGNDLESMSKCVVWGKRLGEARWAQHTLASGRFEIRHVDVRLPVDSRNYDMLKIVAETKTGAESAPAFYFKKKPQGEPHNVHIEIEPFDDFTTVVLTTHGIFTGEPVVSVKEGLDSRRVVLHAVDMNNYAGAFKPADTFPGPRDVEVQAEVNGSSVTAHEQFEIFPVSPRRAGSFTLPEIGILVSYDSAAVFKPLYMTFSQERMHGSSIYELEPIDVLLNRGIRFSVPIPDDAEKRHLGLYFRSNGGWVLQSAQRDQGQQTFSTTVTRTLGDLALFSDDEPPTIGSLRVQPRRGKILISFRYHDNMSGVDPDEIKLYIDGQIAIPEIDGEHRRVSYESDDKLNRGKHSLSISMKDRMKNETVVDRTFRMR